MPWILVTVPPSTTPVGADDGARDFVADCAAAVSEVLGLTPDDVIVLLSSVDAASGRGAVVTIAGRRRGDEQETALTDLLVRRTSDWTGIEPDRIAVLRH